MPIYFSMPKLGMNMTEGLIVSWLVQEGDPIETGQPVVEVETDKAVNTIEAPASGILARIIKGEGEVVPCTLVMAVIIQAGEPLPDSIPDAIADGVRPKAEVEAAVSRSSSAAAGSQAMPTRRNVPISPSAKILATELGVDVSTISPKGERITRKDVETAYAALQAAKAAAVEGPAAVMMPAESQPEPRAARKKMTLMRRRIAEQMSTSARMVARVGLKLEADVTRLIAWRDRLRNSGVPVGYSELLVKLVAQALSEFPGMNARLVEDEIWEMDEVNIGVAVDTDGGLLAPVIQNADKKELLEINRELSQIVDRARQGKSLYSDLEGGTFTITNLGAFEIEEFLPIINFPECAILGIGAIVRKPVAAGEQVQIRPRMALTLAFDHRLVDGVPAARFLQRVKYLVENPTEA